MACGLTVIPSKVGAAKTTNHAVDVGLAAIREVDAALPATDIPVDFPSMPTPP